MDSPSAEVSSALLDALKTMAGLQTEHTGLVTYHFARPDPQNRPNHFEFTELYANDATFWAHAAASEFTEAYRKGFSPANKLQSTIYGYGPGLEGKVKLTCDAVLNCRYPKSTAGFVMSPQQWDRTAGGEDRPILLVARIQAKEGKASEILQHLSGLSEAANSGVIVCHGSIPEEENEPNSVELVEVCSTNAHLTSHLGSDTGRRQMTAIAEAAVSVTCEGYGSVLPPTVQLFNVELDLKLVTLATDAGYVLHPNADPLGSR